MTDLPTDTAELQARLVKARAEYGKLLLDRNRLHAESIALAQVIRFALAAVRLDAGPDGDCDHPLVRECREMMESGLAAVAVIRRLNALWPGGRAPESINDKQEWVRLLTEVRTVLVRSEKNP